MGNLRGNSTDATAAGTNGVETPRTGTARSDEGAGKDEAGGGEATGDGKNQRSSAPRGLSAEAAEAAAGDMDIAEAPEASAESAADAGSRPRPDGWASWTRNQRKIWLAAQRKKQLK